MKQVFAIFCAICLMPSMTSFGWVGGPFSNNTYFGENGDDGVYEAVGVPISRGGRNGIGLFRWGVTNNLNPTNNIVTSNFTFTTGGSSSDFVAPTAGNVQLGAVSRFNHNWFLRGVYYRGFCEGTANSGIGVVTALGVARAASGITGTGDTIQSGFRARFTDEGDGIPSRRFEGRGRATTSIANFRTFRFFAFGTKVADSVNVFTQ